MHAHLFAPLLPTALKLFWPLATLPVVGGVAGGKEKEAARPESAHAVSERHRLFEDLVAKYRQLIYRVAYRMAGNPEDAQDLVQDTIVDAFRSFHKFQPGTRFDRWMLRVLTHNYIDRRRSNSIIRVESLDQPAWDDDDERTLELPDVRMDPARRIEEHLDETIQRALDELTEEYRAAVILCDIAGLSYEEIAGALKVPIGTVRSRINRGRGILKKKLAEYARSRYRL